jgi:GNAT superfamily N-acetyltransferase
MVRLGKQTDITQLKTLNKKWLWENLSEDERKRGFLTCDAYSEEDFERIITANEIAVFQDQGKIVGYYLFDNYSKTETLIYFEKFISNFAQRNLLINTRLSKRAQVVIDEDYQGKGIYQLLINYLHEHLKIKFDNVFSIVFKNNPRINNHLRSGWKIIAEDDERYFVLHEI